ncbi:MAG: O-antigen ligase family protein [Clostridia bacterium]
MKDEIKLEKFSKFMYDVFTSHPFMLLQVIMGSYFSIEEMFVPAIFFFGIIVMCQLLLTKDITPIILPIMLLSFTVIKMYGAKVEMFKDIFALAVLIMLALFSHFIIYKKKFSLGKQFYPLVAVSIALIFGGLFSIDVKGYFNPTALYYTFALSLGMILIYFTFYNYIFTNKGYNAFMTIAKTMLYAGVMGTTILFAVVFQFAGKDELWNIQWSNNLSTWLLLAMPFSFYFVTKYKFGLPFYLFGFLQFLTIFLTLSRGGMIFSFVMLLVCSTAVIFALQGKRRYAYFAVLLIFIISVYLSFQLNPEFKQKLFDSIKINEGEARAMMILVAIRNFLDNPVFGAGIGFVGDYYQPVQHAMYWYHSTPFQIIGSMGLIGICAYTYQFFARLKIFSFRKRKTNLFMFLSFFAFEAMALVNPGDFTPFPSMLFLTLIITLCERCNDDPAVEGDYIKTSFFLNFKSWQEDLRASKIKM